MAGRFAPSPTGDLHLGNLRTALIAWLLARSERRGFLIRVEDLDRVAASDDHERRQLADLEALGLDHDGPVVRQSERFDRYHVAIDHLRAADLVYPCFCSRREVAAEIAAAARAPHVPWIRTAEEHEDVMVPDGAYPGTCRHLNAAQRADRAASGRPPAWRLRGGDAVVEVTDRIAGTIRGIVDDVVVRRGDGVPAYNLAVVVDDAAQHVTQVVRGDDLLSSTPRQVHLQRLLGLPTPEYVHVPLVMGPRGSRLAKRDGAVTMADLEGLGVDATTVLRALATSLELPDADRVLRAADLLAALDGAPLDVASIPTEPVSTADLPGLSPSPR